MTGEGVHVHAAHGQAPEAGLRPESEGKGGPRESYTHQHCRQQGEDIGVSAVSMTARRLQHIVQAGMCAAISSSTSCPCRCYTLSRPSFSGACVAVVTYG